MSVIGGVVFVPFLKDGGGGGGGDALASFESSDKFSSIQGSLKNQLQNGGGCSRNVCGSNAGVLCTLEGMST